MRKVLAFSAVAMIAATALTATPVHAADGDHQVLDRTEYGTTLLSDSFDGANGSPPTGDHWLLLGGTSYPGGPANWGTGEVETYTGNPGNVQLKDGALAITPIKLDNGMWTSARVESKNVFRAPVGGKMLIEARIMLPDVTGDEAAGYWPAFWTLGEEFRGNFHNWPSIGEWDILEAANGRNTSVHAFHCGPIGGGPCSEPIGIGGFASCDGNCWGTTHTYSAELDRSSTPEALRFYLDDRLVHEVTSDRIDPTMWDAATHNGRFLILNVAMGGALPGSGLPNDKTVSGKSMMIESVSVMTSTIQGGIIEG